MWGTKPYSVVTTFANELPTLAILPSEPLDKQDYSLGQGRIKVSYDNVLDALKVMVLKRKFYNQRGIKPNLYLTLNKWVNIRDNIIVPNFILFSDTYRVDNRGIISEQIEAEFHNNLVLSKHNLDQDNFNTKVKPLINEFFRYNLMHNTKDLTLLGFLIKYPPKVTNKTFVAPDPIEEEYRIFISPKDKEIITTVSTRFKQHGRIIPQNDIIAYIGENNKRLPLTMLKLGEQPKRVITLTDLEKVYEKGLTLWSEDNRVDYNY